MQEMSDTEKMDEMIRGITGTIQVIGSIVDQNGIPVHDVEIEVNAATGFGVAGSIGSSRINADDGHFQVKRTGVLSIDCLFLKAGFYAERRSFSYSNEAAKSGKKSVTIRDVVVVLHGKPSSAPLEKHEGFLRSDASGPSSVVYTQKLKPSDTPLTAEERIQRKRLNLDRPHFFLDPVIESDGGLSQVNVVIDGVAGARPVLREGRVMFSQPNPGDGFVAAIIPEDYSRAALGFRWMREAPATGYESDLHLSADSDVGEAKVFFYCRIQGKYGKGVITNTPRILTETGTESAGARMVVFLNPTGSRDVSYLHP
jgi:hypothetical protein